MSKMHSDDIIRILDLVPLPGEGGMYRQAWATEHGTAIWFLLRPGDFSALHRLDRPEIWHFYGGAPAKLVLLEPDGTGTATMLGCDLTEGQRPMRLVDPGIWMGARTTGSWTLLGTTMAPPFNPKGFDLALREDLLALYPQWHDEIHQLTRE